jgi:hypothetical protein
MNRNHGRGRAALLFSIILILGGTAVGGFAQAAGTPPVSGTIMSVDGSNVTLTLADKSLKTVVLQGTTLILERDVSSVDQLKAGDAMGVAARRSGMDLIATSINVFAKEMWDVVRKGQFPMATGEVMTNAMASDYAAGMNGHTLIMKYAEGTATITVPDGIPIHRLVSMKPAALTPGMQIVVRGTAASDGTLKAASISFDGPAKT